jgi:hypothetical protein
MVANALRPHLGLMRNMSLLKLDYVWEARR